MKSPTLLTPTTTHFNITTSNCIFFFVYHFQLPMGEKRQKIRLAGIR